MSAHVAVLPPTPARAAAPGKRPHRIAVFSPIYGLNGPVAGLRWWFLARYLTAAGADITVFHETAAVGSADGVVIAGGAGPREVYVPPDQPRVRRLGLSLGRLVSACWGERSGPIRGLAQAVADYAYLAAQPARGMLAAYERAYAGTPADVLIGSFIGWSGVRAAVALSRRGIPLLLEFRDPWRQYHPHTWRYHQQRIHQAVGRAAAVISVTPLLRARDEQEFGKPALCLPHGFPPEVLDWPLPESQPGPVRVGYFGTMFYPYFDHRTWYGGLALLGPGVAEFHYAGGQDVRVRHLGEQFAVADRVCASPRTNIVEVLRRQRGVDVLLAFASTDPNEPEMFGYKVAEVRAAGRPVLVVGPANYSLRNFLSAGTRVLWATTPAEVAAALAALADEKRRHGGVRAETNETAVRELGWDRIAARLLTEVDRLVPVRR